MRILALVCIVAALVACGGGSSGYDEDQQDAYGRAYFFCNEDPSFIIETFELEVESEDAEVVAAAFAQHVNQDEPDLLEPFAEGCEDAFLGREPRFEPARVVVSE